MDAGLVKGARQAIEVLLKLKGENIVLTPAKGIKIEQPGGGNKYANAAARPSQKFAIRGRDRGSSAKVTGESGVTMLIHPLVMTGRHDALADIGDEWSDGTNRYRIDEIVIDNEYKREFSAVGIGPEPTNV